MVVVIDSTGIVVFPDNTLTLDKMVISVIGRPHHQVQKEVTACDGTTLVHGVVNEICNLLTNK